MDKFKGILLCTDLDETLLTSGDKRLTEENKNAIEYFMSEGGLFTFATGRVPAGIKTVLDMITPNAPMICFNGGAIYDFANDRILWGEYLDKKAIEAVEYVDKKYPRIGIEICTDNIIYFCKENRIADLHRNQENIRGESLDYHNIFSPWKKGIFLVEEEDVAELHNDLINSPFAEKYDFMQSSANYYEIMPKGISKGSALLRLADMLNIDRAHTIGIGDNINDVMLIKNAGIGIAVANAMPEAREAADFITVDNNSNALAAVITSLEIGRIGFEK